MFESRVVGGLAAVDDATAALAALPDTLHRLPSAGLGGVLERLDALAARGDAARVLLTGEAETRGVVAQSTAASTTDWVAAHARSLEPGEAHRLALVAQACAAPGNEPLAAAARGPGLDPVRGGGPARGGPGRAVPARVGPRGGARLVPVGRGRRRPAPAAPARDLAGRPV